MIILGIDPGTTRIGFGLIKKEKNNLKHLKSGLLEINYKKEKFLVQLEKSFLKILKDFKPNLVVIEKLFFFKNQKTAFEVSEARGVLRYLLEKNNIKYIELTPLEIKYSLCGDGRADKKTIAKFVKLILNLKNFKKIDDVTDALAMAIVGSNKIFKKNCF
ncbi:MAG: crossover junction endodeoxyribonuclease RuvC [Candidatus Pacearchaeota archaeon]